MNVAVPPHSTECGLTQFNVSSVNEANFLKVQRSDHHRDRNYTYEQCSLDVNHHSTFLTAVALYLVPTTDVRRACG